MNIHETLNGTVKFLHRFREALSYWESPIGQYWFCPTRTTWGIAWKLAGWDLKSANQPLIRDPSVCAVCNGCAQRNIEAAAEQGQGCADC
jgi:hypothetical protein